MYVLLVASAFNSLTRRVHAELRDHGHHVAVELALPDTSLADAVRRHQPDLVLAPMLRTAIPEEVWAAHTCLVVHPGPVGDRGPSSLDRAIQDGETRWGVTVLQADAEMDAGDVWACAECPVPPVGKSDLYRGEIADAALEAVLLAVERFASGTYIDALKIAQENPRRQVVFFGIGFETTAPPNAMTVHQAKRLGILEGVRRAVRQLERGEHTVDNAYARAVRPEGNPAALAMLEDVFDVTDRAWRGIGVIPDSGWRLSARYRDFDAEHRFSVTGINTREPAECRSGEVLQGLLKPHECEAFGTRCTPRSPLGATMVSSEGACAAYYLYRRLELKTVPAAATTPLEASGRCSSPAAASATWRSTARSTTWR